MFETINKRTGEVTRWVPVFTDHAPCPICGKPTTKRRSSYCCMSSCGTMVCCGHAGEGGRKFGDAGRIFMLDGSSVVQVRNYKRTRRTAVSYMPMLAFIAQYSGGHMLGSLASTWGVSLESLAMCGAGCITNDVLKRFAGQDVRESKVWTIPMYDGRGRVIGIRIRTMNLKGNFSVSGSINGLFGPVPLVRDAPPGSAIIIVEGASDTAAMNDKGFFAIGKASARTTTWEVYNAIRGRGLSAIVVCDGDRDGIEGAEKTVETLADEGIHARICKVPDGAKDVRASGSSVEAWSDAFKAAMPRCKVYCSPVGACDSS